MGADQFYYLCEKLRVRKFESREDVEADSNLVSCLKMRGLVIVKGASQ